MAFKLGIFLILICSLTTALANPDVFTKLIMAAANSDCKVVGESAGRFRSVSFQLMTPCKNTEVDISNTKSLVTAPGFDVNKKTVVYVGGFFSIWFRGNQKLLTKSYLCRNTENFIVVNTDNVLMGIYKYAANNTQELGRTIARGLINMGIPGKNIHLIGHSLGAHTMGVAARTFAAETNDKIGRVTGLDPARPCFINNTVLGGLTSTDATFVDVIHTNPTEAGTEEAIGGVDFYPGGLKSTQVGCDSKDLPCSHSKSARYYVDTIYPGNEHDFMASKCDSYASLKNGKCTGAKSTMGYAVDPTARGIYYLTVDATSRSKKVNPEKCGICTA